MISARDAFVDTKAFSRERAKPLAPEDRRAAILDAVIPLLKESGRDVSTRQMADAAGVAEGTLFRAFGDKESIIAAAVERFMDTGRLRDTLRGIDPEDPTEQKVHQVLTLLRERFEGVIGFMRAVRMEGPPKDHRHPDDSEWEGILDRTFREDELAVPVDTFAFYLRLLAFGTSIPFFNARHPFTTDELTALILHGVLPVTPPERTT